MTTKAEVREEIRAARRVVLDYFTPDEQALLRLVKIRVTDENPHDGLASNQHGDGRERIGAIYHPDASEVEIFLEPLLRDLANDPETRRSEIEHILRHEFHHALGRNYDEYAPREQGRLPAGWYEHEPLTVYYGDLVIKLP
jgi:predicted Zn-dependent protease with MMP-like domain